MARNPMDRSAAFTVLLEKDRQEGKGNFAKAADPEAREQVTAFLEDFHASGETNMWTYADTWLADRQAGPPEAAGRKQLREPDSPRPDERLRDVAWEHHGGQELGQ
jgi:hypothetical protein